MSSLPRKVGKRSQYPEAFKRDAVRLGTERSVKVAAEELGLSASMLSKWRKRYLTSEAALPKRPQSTLAKQKGAHKDCLYSHHNASSRGP